MDYKNKTILFGGDFFLDDANYSISPQIINIFKNSNYSILNLESPIVPSNKISLPVMKAGPSIVQHENAITLLKRLGVRYVSGANNHIFDYGTDGLNNTKVILSKNNIVSRGFGKNSDDATKTIDLEDSNISIICICEEEFGIAGANTPGSRSMYGEDVIEQIKKLSQDDRFVIIYAHGGGEKIPLPSLYINKRFKQFVDAGAKAVIAHHPHVIQGFEIYKESPIFYSLGNFVHAKYKQSRGMLVTLEIDAARRISNISNINIQLKDSEVSTSEDSEINDYISSVNRTLNDKKLFRKVLQEQALYMYESYYEKYLTGLFIERLSFKIKLYKFIKRILNIRKSNIGKKERDEYIMLHLLRNNSHKDFIEMALKIKTKETEDLRDQESKELWLQLINFTRNG